MSGKTELMDKAEDVADRVSVYVCVLYTLMLHLHGFESDEVACKTKTRQVKEHVL